VAPDVKAMHQQARNEEMPKTIPSEFRVQSWLVGASTSYQRQKATSSHDDIQFGAMQFFSECQRSVLGPILFLLYSADLLHLIKNHHLMPHAYADDIQIYGHCQPSDAGHLMHQVYAVTRFRHG